MTDDDLRESRNRDARSRADSEGRTVAAPHSPRRHVGRVVNPPPPGAVAPLYRDTHPVRISGPDKAGATAVLAVDASITVPVLVFGSVPPAGQDLVARNYRGRWEAYIRAGGGSGVSPCPDYFGPCGLAAPWDRTYTVTFSGGLQCRTDVPIGNVGDYCFEYFGPITTTLSLHVQFDGSGCPFPTWRSPPVHVTANSNPRFPPICDTLPGCLDFYLVFSLNSGPFVVFSNEDGSVTWDIGPGFYDSHQTCDPFSLSFTSVFVGGIFT